MDPVTVATAQSFRADQGYDLSKTFVSGTSPAAIDSSFTTEKKAVGYTAGRHLLAWWQCKTTGIVSDSSGNGHTASQSNVNLKPSLVTDSPSGYISPRSLLFDPDGGSSQRDGLDVSDSTDFIFGTGTVDKPFSISAWIKITETPTAPGSAPAQIIGKYSNITGTDKREWRLSVQSNLSLDFAIFDDSVRSGDSANNAASRYYRSDADTIVVGEWMHVAGTYDGRGGAAAHTHT